MRRRGGRQTCDLAPTGCGDIVKPDPIRLFHLGGEGRLLCGEVGLFARIHTQVEEHGLLSIVHPPMCFRSRRAGILIDDRSISAPAPGEVEQRPLGP